MAFLFWQEIDWAKLAIWYRDVFGDKAYDKLITRYL